MTAAPATQVSCKSCAPFTKCITKTDGTIIDDIEDLDLAMLLKQQEVYGFILKTKQLFLMLILKTR